MTLRPMRDPDDMPFLFALFHDIRIGELAQTGWPDEQKIEFLTQQFTFQHHAYTTNYPGAQLDIVEMEGASIGRWYVHRGRDDIRVMDIAIAPTWRNHGIGQWLLREVMDEGTAAGKPVTIHVEKMNPAMRLYLRLGFVKIKDAEVYDLLGWTPQTTKAPAA
ncbi:MAG: GNAT family N-acetyltransferase [Rhodospirillaceae bacterium]|nr:GNAT family N-acetyltransferase [Rhodospirillales bacterium]